MTAKSNTILSNLATVLTAAGFALVTTRKLGWRDLATTEFSAVIIEPGAEALDAKLQNIIESFWRLTLRLHVTSATGQTACQVWFEQAALVCRTIAANRQLSGMAVTAEITEKQPDTQVFEPWASGTLGLTIRYRYNDLTQGG